MNFEIYYETTGVCTDTRNIQKDSLFICLKGENFNGNDFAKEAIKQGAKYVICDEKKHVNEINIFFVEDTLKYLQQLANHHRLKFSIPIIGITGTNGKTTSKELINHVLSQKFKVLATKGNLNNHIGVPLTLLQLTNKHQLAIIEMGANKPGDIKELVEIAEPTHCIITNIGKAHLEGFGSYEGVIRTKGEMYQYADSKNATIFYNNEDEVLLTILPNSITTIAFQSLIKSKLIKMNPFVTMEWSSKNYISGQLETKMIGKYNYQNFLAAIAIGNYFGVENKKIDEAVCYYEPTNNRSQVQKTKKNTLILDAYNANPSSMKNAIESFDEMKHSDKLLILGDMFELGEVSKIEHQKVIQIVKSKQLNCIYVGKYFFNEKKTANNELFFESKNELIEHLKSNEISNKLILLKASRGIGLEAIVEYL